jgi:integrase/recombinase XerD
VSTVQVDSDAAQGEIESLLLDFLAYLELERGLSRNTLEAYRSDLLQFGEFLQRRGVRVMQAQHSDLAAFLAELSGARGDGTVEGVETSRATGATGATGATEAAGVTEATGAPGAALARAVSRPPAAAATLGRKVACLRSFYRHLRREGLIEHDPTAALHGPR